MYGTGGAEERRPVGRAENCPDHTVELEPGPASSPSAGGHKRRQPVAGGFTGRDVERRRLLNTDAESPGPRYDRHRGNAPTTSSYRSGYARRRGEGRAGGGLGIGRRHQPDRGNDAVRSGRDRCRGPAAGCRVHDGITGKKCWPMLAKCWQTAIFGGSCDPQNGLPNLVGRVGLEPTTFGLKVRCSAN